MNQTTLDLFTEFLKNNKEVLHHAESWGIFTVHVLSDAKAFQTSFNRWNESHGIILSLVRITPLTYIVYSGNGVRIADLTGEN